MSRIQGSGSSHIWLAFLAVFLITCSGFAQAPTILGRISTYAGTSVPLDGAQATTQPLSAVSSAIPDGAGGFFVSSVRQHRVYRVTADGSLRVIAGRGTAGFSGDGGPATAAELSSPTGLATDMFGNLFIADFNNFRIRKVAPDGRITTVAGNGSISVNREGDGGPAIDAQLLPVGVAVDRNGNLFIAEDGGRIRKVTSVGLINTAARIPTTLWGGDGLPPNLSIAVDAAGNLFVPSMTFYDNSIRKVRTDGTVETVAGIGAFGFSGDGGRATAAALSSPSGVAVDTSGNLFISDLGNGRIRKVTSDGVITTIAGTGYLYAHQDGDGDGGPALAAQFRFPSSVSVDTAGNIFVADRDNYRVRKITPGGLITTVAGNGTHRFSGDGSPANVAILDAPKAVTVDATGNLFIADEGNYRIRKVTPDGRITTVAGNGRSGGSGDGGPAISAQLGEVGSLSVDAAGNLFIVDSCSVRKVNLEGVITTVVGLCGLANPSGVAVDASGNLFIADFLNDRVLKITPDRRVQTVAGNGTSGFSGDGGPATSAQLYFPFSVAVDAAGNLFIGDYWNYRIRKVTPDGRINTIAGNGTPGFGGDGGPAIAAQLDLPRTVAVDAVGNLFITFENRVRKVTPDGRIFTVAGSGARGFSGDDGPAEVAAFTDIRDVAVDASGSLFIADTGNDRIRKVTFIQQVPFSIADRGAMSLRSSGISESPQVGYATIRSDAGGAAAGLEVLGFRQNDVLVSETSIPASPPIQSGRLYVEMDGLVNTGVAMVNPHGEPATVTFVFNDTSGNSANGLVTIPANGQISTFLNQPPFNGPSTFDGTFSFAASMPIAVTGMRGRINERREFLMTTLPVFDVRAPAGPGTIVFPHFADGAGWTTQIVLVNPTDRDLSGTVQFVDASGQPIVITVDGQTNVSFVYSLPARSSQKLRTAGSAAAILSGAVRVVPAGNSTAPSGFAIFSLRTKEVIVTETIVAAAEAGTAFRLFAESSGSIQTGIAIANTTARDANVTFELTRLDGTFAGRVSTLTVPSNGHLSVFLNEMAGFESLQTPLQGVLRLSSSELITVASLRHRTNERNDLLVTSTPPVLETTALSSSILYLPLVADAGGYKTQIIVFSVQPGSSSGAIQFFSKTGGALNVAIR